MALFSNTPKKATKTAKPKKAASAPVAAKDVADLDGRLQTILKAPWFSEKALIGTEHGVYVFAVPSDATKYDVADAIEKIYKVKPRKIRIANLPGKRKALRSGRGEGQRARRHKAYVYLQKGDTITLA